MQVSLVKPHQFCKRKLSGFLSLAKYPKDMDVVPLMYPICESFRLNIQAGPVISVNMCASHSACMHSWMMTNHEADCTSLAQKIH